MCVSAARIPVSHTSLPTQVRYVSLRVMSTYDTHLRDAGKMAVVPSSGDIVIAGQQGEEDEWALHFFSRDVEEELLRHQRELKAPCQHQSVHLGVRGGVG